MKTLSIIVPCYNASKTIKKTIDSFDLENLEEDIDVLLVDDGSSDNTWELIQKYQKKYPQAIKTFKKENGNYGSVINFIKPYINSRFVKTCDADDTYVSENMQRFISELKNFDNTVDIIFTNFSFININTGSVSKNSLTNQFKWTQSTSIYSIDEIAKGKIGYITIHSMTFKTELFKSIKDSPEGIFYTDSFTIYQCLKYSKYIAYIPHLYIYNYFISNEEQSINISNISKRKDQIITVLNAILEDSNLDSMSRKHKTWLFSVMRMIVKFIFLSIAFGEQSQEQKTKDIEEIVVLMLTRIENNNQLEPILNIQLWFMFRLKPKSLVRIIKRAYGITTGKFAASTRSSEKKRQYKRKQFAKEFYESNKPSR